jgi:hypothetical protein
MAVAEHIREAGRDTSSASSSPQRQRYHSDHRNLPRIREENLSGGLIKYRSQPDRGSKLRCGERYSVSVKPEVVVTCQNVHKYDIWTYHQRRLQHDFSIMKAPHPPLVPSTILHTTNYDMWATNGCDFDFLVNHEIWGSEVFPDQDCVSFSCLAFSAYPTLTGDEEPRLFPRGT